MQPVLRAVLLVLGATVARARLSGSATTNALASAARLASARSEVEQTSTLGMLQKQNAGLTAQVERLLTTSEMLARDNAKLVASLRRETRDNEQLVAALSERAQHGATPDATKLAGDFKKEEARIAQSKLSPEAKAKAEEELQDQYKTKDLEIYEKAKKAQEDAQHATTESPGGAGGEAGVYQHSHRQPLMKDGKQIGWEIVLDLDRLGPAPAPLPVLRPDTRTPEPPKKSAAELELEAQHRHEMPETHKKEFSLEEEEKRTGQLFDGTPHDYKHDKNRYSDGHGHAKPMIPVRHRADGDDDDHTARRMHARYLADHKKAMEKTAQKATEKAAKDKEERADKALLARQNAAKAAMAREGRRHRFVETQAGLVQQGATKPAHSQAKAAQRDATRLRQFLQWLQR